MNLALHWAPLGHITMQFVIQFYFSLSPIGPEEACFNCLVLQYLKQEWNAIQDLRRQRFNGIPVLMLLFVGLRYTILLTRCIYFKAKRRQIFMILFV